MFFVSVAAIAAGVVVAAILVAVIVAVVVWKFKKKCCRNDLKGMFPVRHIRRHVYVFNLSNSIKFGSQFVISTSVIPNGINYLFSFYI